MKTYRVVTSISYWDIPNMLYGVNIFMEGIKARGHKRRFEIVFEAADDVAAENVLEVYAQIFRDKGGAGKWSASLQLVLIENDIVHFVGMLREISGP